jgi:acyl-CoA thioesterase
MSARIELPNPTVPRDWAEQMSLEKIGNNKFRSLKGAPFGPPFMKNGEQRARAFGGHVYAQAAYAASRTVSDGFFIHVCEIRGPASVLICRM